MNPHGARIHDRALLDALGAIEPEVFEGEVWRVARNGRDPLRGSLAGGRWSPGDVEVLYTSTTRAGALAEVGFRLSLEPVWPSRLQHQLHAIDAQLKRVLGRPDVASLVPLGVDVARYENFDYSATQAIAAAAHFLGFDGLMIPSARAPSQNLVIFLGVAGHATLRLRRSENVDWTTWRRERGRQ